MRRALTAEGYEQVTIEGLAAEAAVSKQTIYRWWPTKAAILGEALLEGTLPGLAEPVPTTADLRADLRAWFGAVADVLARPQGVALARALIAVTATDPALGDALNERFAGPIVARIVERIERARAAGEVRADADAEALADQFVALASYQALRGRPLGAERLDVTVELTMRGIAAATGD
jgi:AcrR family transcriptional regulator